MISQINIIVLAVNILLCTGPTIIFLSFALVKNRSLFWPFWIGFLTFFISQVILRIPIHTLIFGLFPEENILIPYIIFIVLTAIILEEGGRFIGLKFFLKENRTRLDAIAFGVGFASGCNIFISLITHISKFMIAVNSENSNLTELINPSEAENINILSSTPWSNLLLTGFHNVAFLIIEICLTLIILYGILNGTKSSVVTIVITSCSHIFTEGLGLVLTEILKINEYVVELYLIFIAIISLVFIFISKKFKSFNKI